MHTLLNCLIRQGAIAKTETNCPPLKATKKKGQEGFIDRVKHQYVLSQSFAPPRLHYRIRQHLICRIFSFIFFKFGIHQNVQTDANNYEHSKNVLGFR